MSTTSLPGEHEEYQYLSLVRSVLSTGEARDDRTGTGTLSLFAPPNLRFSLRDQILPLLTTKRVFLRGVIAELLWFVRGATDGALLSRQGVRIWDPNGSRAFLDARGLAHRREGDLGPIYGFQWRHFGAQYTDCDADYAGQGVDQLAEVIRKIRCEPMDRRIILSAWNPQDIPIMALPPCHLLCQFSVSLPPSDASPDTKPTLSCLLFQRSADLGLGLPFNIASYALLTHMIAHVTECRAGSLIIQLGDAHVYKTHMSALETQLAREPKPFPKVKFKRSLGELIASSSPSSTLPSSLGVNGAGRDDASGHSSSKSSPEDIARRVRALEAMREDDFVIEGYQCWPAVKMEMSV